jgi:hypothetical protein
MILIHEIYCAFVENNWATWTSSLPISPLWREPIEIIPYLQWIALKIETDTWFTLLNTIKWKNWGVISKTLPERHPVYGSEDTLKWAITAIVAETKSSEKCLFHELETLFAVDTIDWGQKTRRSPRKVLFLQSIIGFGNNLKFRGRLP